MILTEKTSKFLYVPYAEILHETRLGLVFEDSQRKFDSKILKIHVKM